MNEMILTRPDPINAIPSPEVIVKRETSGESVSVKEEDHDT